MHANKITPVQLAVILGSCVGRAVRVRAGTERMTPLDWDHSFRSYGSLWSDTIQESLERVVAGRALLKSLRWHARA